MSRILSIGLLTFVVVILGSRRKHTLSKTRKAIAVYFSKPTVKQISNLISLNVTTAEQAKNFNNIQDRTWIKIMQIATTFMAERWYFHWQVMAVSFPSSSRRSFRITIAQCSRERSEESDYDLSVTIKRCVLKGLKVNTRDWLASLCFCYSNVLLLYVSRIVFALRDVKRDGTRTSENQNG